MTPTRTTAYLGIFPATTTKLLHLFEREKHITGSSHPTEHRVTGILITQETRKAICETFGALQSRHFNAAARLSRVEHQTSIFFIQDMTKEIDKKHADWAHE